MAKKSQYDIYGLGKNGLAHIWSSYRPTSRCSQTLVFKFKREELPKDLEVCKKCLRSKEESLPPSLIEMRKVIASYGGSIVSVLYHQMVKEFKEKEKIA